MKLLKQHTNKLLTIIKESYLGTEPFAGEYKVINKKEFFLIQLRDSPLSFAVRSYNDFYTFEYLHSTFEPGFPVRGPYTDYTIEGLCAALKQWINMEVRSYLDELNTPDLWQTLEDTWSETVSEIDTTDYLKPFSKEEKIRINLAIDKFQVLVVNNFNPNEEVLDNIKNSLKYLSDASDSQTKFQWKILALSIVLNIAFNLALDPEKFQQLIQLFKQVFSKIIYLLP